MAKPKTPEPTPEPSRIERMLAYAAVSVIGLSIICFAVYLIALGTHAVAAGKSVPPILQIVAILPGVGLPIGFLLLVAVTILVFVRRTRTAKGADK